MLENRGESKNIPVVIFLSDGLPSRYNSPTGTFENGESSGGGTEPTETVGDETIFVAGEFHKYMEEIQGVTYGVGFGIPNSMTNYKVYTPAQYLYAIAEGITGKRQDVIIPGRHDKVYKDKLIAPTSSENVIMADGTSDALENAFASIQKNLEMVNVQVHDKLSRFVTFVGDTPETSHVQVIRKTVNSQGDVVESKVLIQGQDYKSVAINPENGTIDLIFGNTEKALENYVYELSFDIKLKEDVNITAEDKSVGDQNTDFDPENNISSGKSGVRTNEEAYFTFGKDGKTTVKYPHPVIPASATYKPEHQKYIKDNGDGTYDLTLNVTSTKASSEETHTESVPADVLFLVDKSRSMVHRLDSTTEGKYEGSRAEAVNNALTIAIDTLGSYKDIKLGGYKWSDEPSGFFGWYGEAGQAKKKLLLDWGKDKEISIPWVGSYWLYAQGGDIESGGTYPASALTAAVSKLKEDNRENVKKYIIFLTDGEPSERSEYGDSYTAVENLQALMPGTKLYAVGVTKDTNNTFMEKVVRTANGLGEDDSTDGLYINGSNEAEVNAALKQIADEIVNEVTNSTPGVTNVTITDTLSKYAEFAFDTNNSDNVRVTRKTAEGTETELRKDAYTVHISGKTITLSLTNVNDEEGKTNELEKDVTYSITFKVKPTEEAKQDYQIDGGYYRDPKGNRQEEVFTGADGTDAPGNTTSSRQPGFPSNEKAVLSWQYDGAAGKTEYDHPVLQVPQTGQFVVQKIVTIDDNQTPRADAKFIINLEKTEVDGSQGQKFSSVALKNNETSPVVKTEGEAHFTISEAVPMEYSLKGIQVFQKSVGEKPETDVTADRWNDTNKVLTVQPGDDLIVKVTNNLTHEGYFHSVDQVTNRTTGNPADPFTNDKSAAREAAESQPTADTGKRNKKVAEMEEEEGDPLV